MPRSRLARLIGSLRHLSRKSCRTSRPIRVGRAISLEERITPTTVALVGGDLVITAPAGQADEVAIRLDGAGYAISNAQHVITTAIAGSTGSGTSSVNVPRAGITGVVRVQLGDGNDHLVVDYAGGDIRHDFIYDGGGPMAAPGDRLSIVGGAFAAITGNFASKDSGDFVLESANASSPVVTVTYSGLEPVLINVGSVDDLVFNLPAVANNATLGDDGTVGNGLSRLSGGTFEQTDFVNPTNSLTINRGSVDDELALESLPDFNRSLTFGASTSPFEVAVLSGKVTLPTGNLTSWSISARVAAGAQIVVGNDVTLAADSVEIATSATITAGKTAVIRPLTAGTRIDVGGFDSPGKLGLTDAELDRITAPTLEIGHASSGQLVVSWAVTRQFLTHLRLTSGGSIDLVASASVSLAAVETAGGTLHLEPGPSPSAVRPLHNRSEAASSSVSFAGDLAISINNATAYDSFNAIGIVDLNGVDLVLGGPYVPRVDDSFSIVTGRGITGAFNGLADGDTVSLNGVELYITYGPAEVTLRRHQRLFPDATAPQTSAYFGTAVATSGLYRFVGAPNADAFGVRDVGVVYVYDKNGMLVYTLSNPVPTSDSYFGISLATSGDLLVVGASRGVTGTRRSGLAFVFDFGSATPTIPIYTIPNPTLMTSDDFGLVTSDDFGLAVAMSGSIVVVGLPDGFTENYYGGAAYVYDLESPNPVTPILSLYNPTPETDDRFGLSVAAWGSVVVVGAHADDTGAKNAGSAYIYDISSSTPAIPIRTLNNPAPSADDGFGVRVAVSGQIVVIGATGDSAAGTSTGSVYIYNLNSLQPSTPVVTLYNPAPAAYDRFASGLSISGHIVVVGACWDDTGAGDAGSAYVYDLSAEEPTVPILMINNPFPRADDFFGSSLALTGNLLVVGAVRDDSHASNSGSAYVYDLNSAMPAVPTHTLENPMPAAGASFGTSVAVSGNVLVVGAPGVDTFSSVDNGSAYVYDLGSATPMEPILTLKSPLLDPGDRFGVSVAVSGSIIVIGAPVEGFGVTSVSRAYVYDLGSATPTVPILTLLDPASAYRSYFGFSVALCDDVIVVGSYSNDSGATDAGIAYVYRLGSAVPTVPILTLNNPSPGAGDFFGYSVAVAKSVVVVGAYSDDTGANDAGSAYVYDLKSATPTVPTHTLHNPSPATGDQFGYSLAISGGTVVVGTVGDDLGSVDAGSVSVYDLSSATPTMPFVTLSDSAPQSSRGFGVAVSIMGNFLMVGSRVDSSGATQGGSVDVFEISPNSPIGVYRSFENPSPAYDDQFGFSMAKWGEFLVVGAALADSQNTDQGAVYLFELVPNVGSLSAMMSGGDVVINDTMGVVNSLSVSFDGTNIVVTDANERFAGTGGILGATLSADGKTLMVPASSFSGRLVVNSARGADTLTVAHGTSAFNRAITYNAGNDALDTLRVTGGSFGTALHTHTGKDAGTTLYGPNPPIQSTGIRALDLTGSTIADLTIALSTTAGNAILEDDGIIGNGISRLRSTNFFATVTFSAPTGGLSVYRSATADSITVNSLPDFNNSLTLGASPAGFRSVTLAGRLHLTNGSLTARAQSIQVLGAADVSFAGDASLVADLIDINSSATITTMGTTVLGPWTAGSLVDLGGTGGPGSLGLTDGELDRINSGTLRIGSSTSRTLTVSAAITRATATNVELVSGGSVVMNQPVSTAGGTLLLDSALSPAAIRPLVSGVDASASTVTLAGDLLLTLNGNVANSNHDQLGINGIADLSSSALKLTGSYTLAGSDTLTIVAATGRVGTFTNAPLDGDTIAFGSQTLTVNYTPTGVTLRRLVPTPISSLVIADGSAQRSIIRDITVTFGGLVSFPMDKSSAFALTRSGPGGPTGPVTLAVDTSLSTPSQTIARLTFSGSLTQFGSLVDGNYSLQVFGDLLTGDGGQLVDADDNGIAGGTNTSMLHRLFGDSDGNKVVDSADFLAFRLAVFQPSLAFDLDDSGSVDAADFLAFRLNFLKTLP